MVVGSRSVPATIYEPGLAVHNAAELELKPSPVPVFCSKLNKYRHENIQTGNTEETGRGREAVSNYDKSRFCFQQ